MWVYELCCRLSNKLTYLIDLWLHDALSLRDESIPVSKVMKHWGKVIHSFNSARMNDTVLVVDAYYPDEEGRKILKDKKVKYMMALNKQRFPVLCSLVKHGVEHRGQWNAKWCEQRKEVLVHAMNKDGKEFYTLSNAYTRRTTKGSTKHVPVADDYKKMFDMCDKYNKQIKKRVWPFKPGGKDHLGEQGKYHSFAFGCVLQNTFNAYRDMNNIDKKNYEYYSYCEVLARQLYEYSNALSDASLM